jgi:hypothetical protein
MREFGKMCSRGLKLKRSCEAGLAAGMLTFRLSGRKLQGSFVLIRTRGMGKKESRLLITHADGYTQADDDASAYDCSAGTFRSLARIAAEPKAAQ